MSKPDINMKRRSINEWLAETLRLTLFLSMGEKVEEQNWWRDLLGIDASNTNIQRESRQRQEEGAYEDDRRLVLSIQPDRVDWRLTPPNVVPEAGHVPNTGQYLEAMESFSKLLLHWLELESCPSASRLALGLVLITPAKTVPEGYQQISAYLPFNFDTRNASDLMYQVNRARDSESVPGIKINRLSKWSVSSIHWVSGRFFKGMVAATPLTGPQALNCRLELDINTVPKPGLELAKDDLRNLYQEFAELAKEIVQDGDIV